MLTPPGGHGHAWFPDIRGTVCGLLWVVLLLVVGVVGEGDVVAGDAECGKLQVYGCTCTESNTKVQCVNLRLVTLPDVAYFPQNILKLYLGGNRLTRINFSDSRFSKLQILDLASNRLGSTSGISSTIKALQDLQELYLENNEIQGVDFSYLTGTKINILDLSNNPVAKIKFQAGESNQVETMYLKNLSTPDFPFESLEGFKKLTYLDLSGNQLTQIPEDAFLQNTKIETLYLNNNKLTTLSETVFNNLSLTKLYLEDNPWNCDCSLKWLHTKMNTNIIEDVFQNSMFVRCEGILATPLRDLLASQFTCKLGPGSCVPVGKTSVFVTYPYYFNISDAQQCQQKCFNKGSTYFNIYDSKCLCGRVKTDCTCSMCSTTFHVIQNAKSTLTGLKVNYDSPVRLGVPVTISKDWTVNVVSLQLDFGDGSVPTDQMPATHAYLYPGEFRLQLSLCSVSKQCFTVPSTLVVSSLGDSGAIECPTRDVSTKEAVPIQAVFTSAHNADVLWSRKKEGDRQAAFVLCDSGHSQLDITGHCFYLVASAMTWTQASEHCGSSHGGYLAVANDDQVTTFLVNLMKPSSISTAWIGLRQSERWLENYKWSNQMSLGSSTKWTSSEPRLTCVYLTDAGQWMTDHCDESYIFLCEYVPNGLVNTEIHIAGSLDVGKISTKPVQLRPTTPTAGVQHSLMYIPGFWFTKSGTVRWFTFRAASLATDTYLQLGVYRPTCTGRNTLYKPGCDQKRFSSCAQTESCSFQPAVCTGGQQSCYLTSRCISTSQACSCAGEHDRSITCQTSGVNADSRPSYRYMGSVGVSVVQRTPGVFTVMTDMKVQEHDVLGIVYSGSTSPIECSDDVNSQWGQSIFTIAGIPGTGSDIPADATTVEKSLVCHFNAFYSNDKTVHLPRSLNELPGPGRYTFSYKVLLDSGVQQCTVRAVEPVGNIAWVSPSHSGGNTIKVDMYTLVTLLVMVSSGSDLNYHWTIGSEDKSSNNTVSGVCPNGVDNILASCASPTSTLDNPFVYIRHIFNAPTTVALNVSNSVSWKELEVNVILGACMPIKGLTLCHESCSRQCTTCEPLIKVGMATVFQVHYTQGSEYGIYTYYIGDTQQTSVQASNTSLTFATPGRHIVMVNLTCEAHSQIDKLEVVVKQAANIDNLVIVAPPAVAWSDTFTLKIKADVDMNAELDISVDFNDGAPAKNVSLVTSSAKLDQAITHAYTKEDIYKIVITVGDSFQKTSINTSILILAPVSIASAGADPQYSERDMIIYFRAVTEPLRGSLVKLASTSLWYNWSAPVNERLSSKVLNSRLPKRVTVLGTYNITLHVGNAVSEASTTVMLYIRACVTSLTLQYTGPTQLTTQASITAVMTGGTNVEYSLDPGDGGDRINQTDGQFLVTYSKPGIYNVSVTAHNLVNSCKVYTENVMVYVIDNDTVFLLDILPHTCLSTGTVSTLAVVAVSIDPLALNYSWDLGNGTTDAGTGKLNVTVLYKDHGTYNITVSTARGSTTRQVCVQEEITKLTFVSSAPVNLTLGEVSTRVMETSVDSGSDILYSWMVADIPQECKNSSCSVHFMNAGPVSISVNASNNISYDTARVNIEALYRIQNLTITCRTCRKTTYLSTARPGQFQATAGNGSNVTYLYDFGDGLVSDTTKTFNNVSKYLVCVNATNLVSTSRDCMNIITQDPVQGLTMEYNASTTFIEIEIGTSIVFDANITGGTSVTYRWNCGNGTKKVQRYSFTCHFITSMLWKFSLNVFNKVSDKVKHLEIYVIEEITRLSVNHDLVHGKFAATQEAVNLTAVSNTYLRVTFHWRVLKDNMEICDSEGREMKGGCSVFSDTGKITIILNANNSLGSKEVNLTFTVFNRIEDLDISTVASAIQVNTTAIFKAATAKSSYNVKFQWTVSRYGDVSVDKSNKTSTMSHYFGHIGQYAISVNAISDLEPQGITANETIFVEEVITKAQIRSNGKGFIRYLQKSSTVDFDVSTASGSSLQYSWQLVGPSTAADSTDEQLKHTFTRTGKYSLTVRVYNHISNQPVSETFYVEDQLTSVDLNVKHTFIETKAAIFFEAISSPKGEFFYNWTINGELQPITISTFQKSFQVAGIYKVNIRVYNNVSFTEKSNEITVQDLITGLAIDKCQSMVRGTERTLTATSATGTDVSYSWKLTVPNGSTVSRDGDDLTYDFDDLGLHDLVVVAKNQVSSATLTCTIRSQGKVVISQIKIESKSKVMFLFVKQMIVFEVVGEYLTGAKFVWKFKDGTISNEKFKLEREFDKPGSHQLTVVVENEVSLEEKTVHFTILVLNCKLPKVQVVSRSPARGLRSRPLNLAVVIDFSNCQLYQAKHKWQIYHTDSCRSSRPGQLVDLGRSYTESPTLLIKAKTLLAGTYCALFNTSYLDTFVHETARIDVTIVSSPLTAVISGGSERTTWTQDSLLLSCKDSFDPDDSGTQLSCSWSCTSSGSCPWSTRKDMTLTSKFPVGTYNITLTVTDGSRSSTVQQTLTSVSLPGPAVSLRCISCQTAATYKISSANQVALASSCTNCGSRVVEYTWTVLADGASVTLTPDTQTRTGLSGPNLVLMENVLPKASTYSFSVSVRFQGERSTGSSTLELLANSAPTGGLCSVTPTSILNLETPVTVQCSGWTDDDTSQLSYKILATGVSAAGPVLYPVYHGPYSEMSVYLASIPGADQGKVNLEVKVIDELGASTAYDLQTITFKSPTLDATTSRIDYIMSKAQFSLPSLLKRDDPTLLLPYVIALSQELNQQYDVHQGVLSREKRATMRDAITMSLAAIPVSTLEDVQQVAYLLQLLTKYFDEYQTEACHLVIVESLKNITGVLQTFANQGRNQEHFVPHHLLATISNLIEAVNLGVYNPSAVSDWQKYPIQTFYRDFSNLRPEISAAMKQVMVSHNPSLTGKDVQHRQIVVPSAFDIAEQIMTTILMTTMWTEKSMVINLGGIEVHGQRTKVRETWDKRELEGCIFDLPDNLFEGILEKEDEIFQIMFVLSKNPFTWGYIKNLTVNSRVPSLSFKFINGQDIPIQDLPQSKNIKVSMFENIVESNKTFEAIEDLTLFNSKYYKPFKNLKYTRATIKGGKAKLVSVDVSEGADTASGIHIQVRMKVVENTTDKETGVVPTGYVDVYLGENGAADTVHHYGYKRISTALMSDGVDHRTYTFMVQSESFRTDIQYTLSVYNNDIYHNVTLSVAVYFSSCQFFNELSKTWDSKGCSVMEESISTYTQCQCDHLTSFGGSVLVPPDAISISDLAELDLATNPVVIVAISILLFMYGIAVLLFRFMDRKDLKRISMIPLCGQDGDFKYEITVVTGRNIGAGTSAHVGIKLYGSRNAGERRHISKQGAFQRNCSDTFLIASEVRLGTLKKMIIWHDNTGLSPSWYISHVVVKDLHNDRKYYFLCNLWLSVEMEAGVLKKEIHAASKKDLKLFLNTFKAAAYHGFADKHLWISLMDRSDHSRFTRVQRATCCVTVCLFFMMVNAMWYGVLKTNSDQTRSMADYSFSWEEIVTGLVSNIMVTPLAILLILLFKRSRSKADTFQQVQKPGSAQTIEIPYDMSHFGSSVHMSPHGDWDSFYDQESTTEYIPATTKLKRTHTLKTIHNWTQDGSEPNHRTEKSSVESIMRMQNLMWNKDNILKNWPEKTPNWTDADQKSIAGSSQADGHLDKRLSIPSSTSTASSIGGRRRAMADIVDSDEEFQQKLDEVERKLDEKQARRKGAATGHKKGKGPMKNPRKQSIADSIFSSDDEWVNEGLAAQLPGVLTAGPSEATSSKSSVKKSINKMPSRAAGASAQTRFNPREEARLRGLRRTSFADEFLSSEDELDKGKGKLSKKTIHMNGQPPMRQTIKTDSKKSTPERKASTSSILKSRATSAGSIRKETSFMKQAGFMTTSDKSQSNMSSIWMKNYYSSSHHMKERSSCMLPSWCIYIAYAVCVVINIISIIVVILYGHKFGAEVSLKWLLSLFLAFCCSALIIEPSKVLILAMYMIARKRNLEEEMEKESIDILPSVQSNETIKDVKFSPLAGFALLTARDEGHKVNRMYTMLRQTVMHMFLLTLLLAMAYIHYSPSAFTFSHHVQHQLQQSGPGRVNLSNMKSISDFRTWSETVLTDTMHRRELHPLDQFSILLGPARFRQIRGKTDDCPLTAAMRIYSFPSLVELPCDGDVNTEDTTHYGKRWSVTPNVSWRHYTGQELDMMPHYGQNVRYSGGGYLMTLGVSYNHTRASLQQIFDQDWINLETRAVFVEFTLYSVELDLTQSVSVLVEFPTSGGVLTTQSLSTNKLLRFTRSRVDPLMVCEVLFSLCVIYLVVHLLLTLRQQRHKFLRQMWNWLDLVIVLLSIACICVYVACVVKATEAFSYYANHKTDFTNFERASHLHEILRYLHASLLFLFLLKIVHQLRFLKFVHVFGKTLSAAMGYLAGCCLIFLLLMSAYAQLGYLYFGMVDQGFMSFQSSLLTLFGVIRGTVNFWRFLNHWPVMTLVYFPTFFTLTYGLVVALVVAVLNNTYKTTRQSTTYTVTLESPDHEMIEFIMRRFKLWLGVSKQKPAFRRVKFKGLPSLPSRSNTTISSSNSRRLSISSSSTTNSGGATCEPVYTQEDALRLEHKLDNAVPLWENMLSRFTVIEKLEHEEEKQLAKLVKQVHKWEVRNSPKHKAATSSHKKLQLKGKGHMVNKQKGLIGRTAATPPDDSPRKPKTDISVRRPLSNQSERAEPAAAQDIENADGKRRDSIKNVRFSKQAWSK